MKKIITFLLIAHISALALGQVAKHKVKNDKPQPAWTANNPFNTDVFVENLGQLAMFYN